MRLKQPKRSQSMIPTASMADIAFLLIVFFMITTSITVDRTAVALPTSLERTEVPQDAGQLLPVEPLHELLGASRQWVPVGADFGVMDRVDDLLTEIDLVRESTLASVTAGSQIGR